jgi:hypothetical protein
MPQLLARHFPITMPPTEKKCKPMNGVVHVTNTTQESTVSFCPDYQGGLSVEGYFKTHNTKLNY